jgi:hypothetical protein
VSFFHRYTARPEPSVRNVAPDAVAVLIMVPPLDDAFDAGAPVAGVPVLDELLPLEHAATSSTVPTAATTPAPSLSPGDNSATVARSLARILAALLLPDAGTESLAVITWTIVLSSRLPGRLTS